MAIFSEGRSLGPKINNNDSACIIYGVFTDVFPGRISALYIH